MTPDTPADTTPVEEPTEGGSYVREADGTLVRTAGTEPATMAERMAAKRKALGLPDDQAAPQPAPEQ